LLKRDGARRRPFDPARASSYPAVVGCDEVGRGAFCGPVVVAAVWFDPIAAPPELLAALDDSKRLSARERTRVCAMVTAYAHVALAAASAARIDRDGVRLATLDAMRRAVERLGVGAPVRVDGVDAPPGLPGDVAAVVRGETIVPQIAAASVVAKVRRDALMARLGARHPVYRWEVNAGYGTAQHRAALGRFGPTPHHRRSFRPVALLGDPAR
jgi:ribonuclease HII